MSVHHCFERPCHFGCENESAVEKHGQHYIRLFGSHRRFGQPSSIATMVINLRPETALYGHCKMLMWLLIGTSLAHLALINVERVRGSQAKLLKGFKTYNHCTFGVVADLFAYDSRSYTGSKCWH